MSGSKHIRISQETYDFLNKHAKGVQDSMDKILKRLLKIGDAKKDDEKKKK